MRLSGRQPLGLPKKGAFLSAVRAAAAVAAFSQTFDFTTGMPAGVTVTSSPAGYAPKADGTLQSFAANAGRRTDLGLMIEPAATNYTIGSNTGGPGWGFYKGDGAATFTRTANAATAPDGTTTATRYTLSRSTASGLNAWNADFSNNNIPTAGWKTFSCYVKAFAAGDVGKKITVAGYNTTTVLVGADEFALSATWQRIVITYYNKGFNQWVIGYAPNNNGNGNTNLSTQTGTVDFLFWGAQVEDGPVATSLITTTTLTVTRAADNVSITLPSGGNTLKLTYADNTVQYLDRLPGSFALASLEGKQIKTGLWSWMVSQAIGAISFGTLFNYNSNYPTKWVQADTFANTWADNDAIYSASDDTNSWNGGGSSNVQMNAMTSYDSSVVGMLINAMSQWGGSNAKGSDNATYKAGGLISIDGVFFLWVNRNIYGAWLAGNNPNNIQTAFGAQLLKSTDRGVTWTPTPPSNAQPYASPMFPGTPFASPGFVQYGKDYKNVNIHRAGTYVYACSVDGVWNNGTNMIIGRCLKSALGNLSASDWSFYKGGDGMLDANWGTLAQAAIVISSTRKVSQSSIQYLPALKRYVMLQWYYPSVAANPNTLDTTTCTWDVYESPTPWGPWTKVGSQTFNPQGVYNPFVVPKSLQVDGGLTMVAFSGGDFNSYTAGLNSRYTLWEIPMTVTPGAAGSAITPDA